MHVLLASGFFESGLTSFREYSYSKQLAALGHQVTLMCGDQSYIWHRSRVRLKPTNPTEYDSEFAQQTGVTILRRKVFLRVSDFVMYSPRISAIRQADVVHVVEFRTGVTVLIAILARIMGKPVVYDHEQRGDRTARWYSRVDSRFRRSLIFIGAMFIDAMRHTVLANREHFRSCTPRRIEEIFAPLGVDQSQFYFDQVERRHVRTELGIADNETVAIMSGKLTSSKRIIDVVKACRKGQVRLLLVGAIAPEVAKGLADLGEERLLILPQASAVRLRQIYNAADVAIFTTFTVSYWEAYATGLHLIVAASAFSKLVFEDDPHVWQFGDEEMFSIPDEQYRDTVEITDMIYEAIARFPLQERRSRTRFSAQTQCRELSDLYAKLTAKKQIAQSA